MESLYRDFFVSCGFLIVGFLLLFLEVFIPSGGVLGILAVACTIFGAFGLYVQDHGTWAVLSMIGFGGYGILILYFIMKRINFRGAMTPDTSSSVDTRIKPDLLGKSGTTVTSLRPAGMALIDGKKVDVVSVGDFIDKEEPVTVVEVSGNRVVVRRMEGITSS